MQKQPAVIDIPAQMRDRSRAARKKGARIGLVPTMGALHQGHLSLVEYARENCDLLAVSIFVNPIQFDKQDDLKNYPRTWEQDLALCAARGVDVIYAPSAQKMYPQGFQTKVLVENMTRVLCGAFRTGHFDGVTTVVLKLFHAVEPHMAVFGNKDFQQVKVIQRMCQDLDLEVEIVGRPLVREPDGLALSSRNVHLSPQERQQALCLFRALKQAKALAQAGEREASALIAAARKEIAEFPLARPEYVEVVDSQTLEAVPRLDRPARMCLAVWLGNTRLIDNMALN